MDNMSITTAFSKKIITKVLKKKIDNKFGDTSIDLHIEDLEISFDGNGGSFRLNVEGEFTQDDILKLLKGLI